MVRCVGPAARKRLTSSDPLLAKYTRFNKAGIICPSAVTSIRWLPNQLFVSSHADGSVVIWSPDKDDATFVPSSVPRTPLMSEGVPSKGGDIVVTRPPTLDAKGALNRFNPVTFWNVTDKAVTAFAFSHDLLHCAVVGADGLRIIDTVTEQYVGLPCRVVADAAQAPRHVRGILWSADLRCMVPHGTICARRRPGRPRDRVLARNWRSHGAVSGTHVVCAGRGLPAARAGRPHDSLRLGRRGLQARAVGLLTGSTLSSKTPRAYSHRECMS